MTRDQEHLDTERDLQGGWPQKSPTDALADAIVDATVELSQEPDEDYQG